MRYTVLLLPDLEGHGYTVTVPLLPGCVTEGDTVDEALEMAKEAIELYVEVLQDEGQPVPQEPVAAETLAAALADAAEIQRICAEDLRTAGEPIPAELPEPLVMSVDVRGLEVTR